MGFYSAFMVADTVTVISRRYGSEEAWMWQSSGADGYTMQPAQREAAGTDVIMKLKADTEDEKYSRFLEEYELRELVRKYSDYIRYPIRMEVTKSRPKGADGGGEKGGQGPGVRGVHRGGYPSTPWSPLWQRNKKRRDR